MTVFSAPLLGFPDPLTPVQILWVAMMMDGPPAVALALELVASGDHARATPRARGADPFCPAAR